MAKKKERLYIRTTTSNKRFFQHLAELYCKGNMNALFDKLLEELKEEHEYYEEEEDEHDPIT